MEFCRNPSPSVLMWKSRKVSGGIHLAQRTASVREPLEERPDGADDLCDPVKNSAAEQARGPVEVPRSLLLLRDGKACVGIGEASTGKVVRDAGHTALIMRWDGGGFRQDLGASLLIDGNEVLTSDNAGEGASLVRITAARIGYLIS